MSETTHTENTAPQAEQHEFSAEVGRLLDLVVHALYSDREIFLRELVANAADATDKRRFEALTDTALALPGNASIRINPDKTSKLLTISDDGTGMTREELTQNLGTIARSGTRAFGQKLDSAKPEDRPSLIGQFGVGFYAAFMVADRVDVTSRKAGSDDAWMWSSDGKGSYTLSPASRSTPGTDIVMHMKDDAEEFLDTWRLRSIVRKWADHISWPITLRETNEDGTSEDKSANEGTALWRKPKSEITPEQYAEFYRHVAHAFEEPYATLHWHAEGTTEFTALLFLPGARPFDFMEQSRESKIHLHVRRMFITDEAELVPNWMRFVQGVVDTEDLPLNVSREMLQATPVLSRIRKAVTKRVLNEIKTRAKDAESGFDAFWENFGPVIKEGLWEDGEHRQEIAGFARFHSTHDAALTTLDDYISRMKDGQDVIYYLTGDNMDALKASAQLEGFTARGLEVLLLTDPVDGFWPERLNSYQDKTFRSVSQSHGDLEKFEAASADTAEPADLDALIPALKDALGDQVKDVRSTVRLTGSAVVITSEGGPDMAMQRLLRRSGQAMPATPPILEINPRHPLIRSLSERVAKGENIADHARVLLDIARVQEGEALPDASGFARILATLLAGNAAD
ncbi:molecular chaperone HtpG [Gluconobacter wancherniae]|uniref:Chaperone protein HtpG n=1 Tax=Gluconobacter wancherniae NBRC 103581 TaxID=656744 RepID=A0A511B237_9PROT|nr:molecular chaperone HtpG [Gluconobacter wancherniae]MBF0854615.1 molecular chaperone HtpG [Gluconobacter wancherniae]GBD57657.1 chaperone protein HtpG [Gluconobacter wancherniae NBRC 103581]GBR62266.1 heat shock protein 90 [Gluconobacter wancherniae NBRC 103581]GEK94484.1 chaperone protein HtpG [Gluconobacter wancherniae NBRC 103581]